TTGTSLAERDCLRGSRDDRTSPILANILVRASGWEEDQRLLDPFCRAGTIPIEAGRIACNIPNSGRSFAFLDLKFVDREEYAQIAQNAKQAMNLRNLPLEGSDPDPSGATMSAKASGFDEMQFQKVHALERDLDADTIIFRSPFIEQRSKRNEIADVMEKFEDQLLNSSVDHATCFTQDRDFFSRHDTEQRASWQHMDGWVLTWDT
ncbi:MAG: hypothetical protein SVU32_07810, partial [Candidatus Nanohaloarchaea archaeon]|nr:hypothetical protein [Candidatus Nanohaloarchaea archaeon]